MNILCGNVSCFYQMTDGDTCTAPKLDGIVPYEFNGDVKHSCDNCKQYRDRYTIRNKK